MKKMISGVSIELRQGDIANQADCDAVVNAANAQLESGGGVAGAIHRAAGPGLAKEARPLGPIKPGQAVITGAHDLPNKHVIHCLGPVYGKDKPEGELLSRCYGNALDLAEQNEVNSISFPAISTGIFGYPVEEAAKVAFSTLIEKISHLKKVKRIVFVLYSNQDLETHKRVLEQTLQGKDYPG
ncbi:macro domain-containing protein [Salinimicrobium sediminilitoris]|uniref:macro domain-containing protein n=1 Tax=Salinimicrobium sediminilitoris TaxID=2876715 RepID=UPI001E35B962|nr:macro domain-containing protein [Salinimicrobium sediminilitoris]MCC8359103.1 macro domain-containing protein [Salinimicrobium sediminilitoris]